MCVLCEPQEVEAWLEKLRMSKPRWWFLLSMHKVVVPSDSPSSSVSRQQWQIHTSEPKKGEVLARILQEESGCVKLKSLLHALSHACLQEMWLLKRGAMEVQCHIPCQQCRLNHMPSKELAWWSEVRPSELVRSLTQALPSMIPYAIERSNVYDRNESRVRSIGFGLLIRRGRGISVQDERCPQVLRLVHALALCRSVNHPYCAIQINHLQEGQGLKAHIDERNWGDSWCLAFGDYDGGELQIEQEEGGHRAVRNYLRWVRIPHGRRHWVSKVTRGNRYSIVLYTPAGFTKALDEHPDWKKTLEEKGYQVPTVEEQRTAVSPCGVDRKAIAMCLKPGAELDAKLACWASHTCYNVEDLRMLEETGERPCRLLLVPSPQVPLCWNDWHAKLQRMEYPVHVQFEDMCDLDVLERLRRIGQTELQALQGLQAFQQQVQHEWPTVSSMCVYHENDTEDAYPAQSSPLDSNKFAPFQVQDERGLIKILRQTHEKMGHPHNDQFIRVLRQAGASELVLTQARQMQCSVCQSHRTPKPQRVSALVPSYEFNAVVGMDVFHLQGLSPGQQVHVLSIVDWSTLYHICVLIREVTAAKVRRAYRRYWLRVFGAPQRVVTDQGREFVGAEMAERLETDGSHHEIVPAESPWQNGRTERHGGILKLIFTKARLTSPPRSLEEVEELMSECCSAKNRFTLVGGFSPYQRVFGTQLRLPGLNLGDELQSSDIGAMSALESGDPVLLRSFQFRKAAQEAYHYVDSSARVRRAVLSGPRPVQQYLPGDTVFFWRRDADIQAFRIEHVHAHWHGPAIVIGQHKAKIWVSFRGHLWLCSPEQIRKATHEELQASDLQRSELIEAARTLGSGTHPSESEPATSAREVGPQDVNPGIPLDPGADEVDVRVVPATPAVLPSASFRGRSPGPSSLRRPDLQERSRSRQAREDSFWICHAQCPSEQGHQEGIDQALEDYLSEFGTFFSFDMRSRDCLEWVCLSSELGTSQVQVQKRKELVFHRLNSGDQKRFASAMLQEWKNNILRPEAVELLSLEDSEKVRQDPETRKRVVPTRWVLVEKDQGVGQETLAKARLVVQGFRDPDLEDLEVASPTLSKDSLPLILQMLASFRSELFIADIKGAFMSSRPLQREGGDLFAALPQTWLHPQEADPRQLLKIKVAWYGLNDGPREFYETLDHELSALGCQRLPLDPCVYL